MKALWTELSRTKCVNNIMEKSALKLQVDIFICLTWSTSSDKCFIYPEIVYHNAKQI